MRILVVEDDPRLSRQLAEAINGAGYLAIVSHDGEDALHRASTEAVSAIILDIGLPTLDGLSVLRRLRRDNNRTPVLLLTARSTWTERVDGIDAGADDYVTKPFHIEEVLARLRAVIRRSAGLASSLIEHGDLVLDERQSRVALRGVTLPLTKLEYRLLAYLMRNRGRLVAQAELIDHIYGDDAERDLNAIEALVVRLRKKVGAGTIETRRGFGYVIPDSAPSA